MILLSSLFIVIIPILIYWRRNKKAKKEIIFNMALPPGTNIIYSYDSDNRPIFGVVLGLDSDRDMYALKIHEDTTVYATGQETWLAAGRYKKYERSQHGF